MDELINKKTRESRSSSISRFLGKLVESACNVGDPSPIPGSGRAPGEGNSTLAWRILWTEEPGGLESTGSQRVGHD